MLLGIHVALPWSRVYTGPWKPWKPWKPWIWRTWPWKPSEPWKGLVFLRRNPEKDHFSISKMSNVAQKLLEFVIFGQMSKREEFQKLLMSYHPVKVGLGLSELFPKSFCATRWALKHENNGIIWGVWIPLEVEGPWKVPKIWLKNPEKGPKNPKRDPENPEIMVEKSEYTLQKEKRPRKSRISHDKSE